MKLLVQRVTSATVEVDGYVESRISSGLVLNLVLTQGDSTEKAQRLAKRIVKLKLWPEVMNPQQMWRTNIVENGYEILVILQQTLCSTFQKLEPNQDGAMDEAEAKSITESFVKMLQAEYQEEMVVASPNDPNRRIEIISDGPCLFELDGGVTGVAPRGQPPTKVTLGEVEPEIISVTKALRLMPRLPKSKATVEGAKILRLFSLKKFRAALANAEQAETDAFAEALDSAAGCFSAQQQKQITAWTGLTITVPPIEESFEDDMMGAKAEFPQEEMTEEIDGLDEKLAALKDEVENPAAAGARKKRPRPSVKNEFFDPSGETANSAQAGARTRPDWTARAAPDTPAASARQWVANRGGGNRPWYRPDGKSFQPWSAGKGNGKGKGPRSYRSMGIVSLDESSRLHHGGDSKRFAFGQHAQYSDQQVHLGAQDEGEDDGSWGAKALKLPKGMPTLAPMTPAPGDVVGDI